MNKKYLKEEIKKETGEALYILDIKNLTIDNLIEKINIRKMALENGTKDENAKRILKKDINSLTETLFFLKNTKVKYKYSNLYIYDRRNNNIKKAKYSVPFMAKWMNNIDNSYMPESIVMGINLLKIIRPYNHVMLNNFKNPKRKLGTALIEITSIIYDDTGNKENKQFIIAYYFEKNNTSNNNEILEKDIEFGLG